MDDINALKNTGALNIFRRGNNNFLYHKENNSTYTIPDNIFLDFTIGKKSEDNDLKLKEILSLNSKNEDVQYYCLYLLGFTDVDELVNRIKKLSDDYKYLEIIYNVDSGDFDYYEVITTLNDSIQKLERKNIYFIVETNIINSIHFNFSNFHCQFNGDIHGYTLFHKSLINIKGVFKFHFHQKDITPLDIMFNDFKTMMFNYQLADDLEIDTFFNFLVSKLQNTELNRIYNVYTVFNYLISESTFITHIEYFNDDKFTSAKNEICEKCWAKNICWYTKSFNSFNINISEIEKNTEKCNALRRFFEEIVYALFNIENIYEENIATLNKTKGKIRLIN